MSLDNLYEEGLATDIDISSSILLVTFLLLGAPYFFHYHKFFFTLWIRLNIFQIFLDFCTYITTVFLFLHAIFTFIWNTNTSRDKSDSTQSGDQPGNVIQSDKPLEQQYITLCLQIVFHTFDTTEDIKVEIPQYHVCTIDLNIHIYVMEYCSLHGS